MPEISIIVRFETLGILDLVGHRQLFFNLVGSLERPNSFLKFQQLNLRHPPPPQNLTKIRLQLQALVTVTDTFLIILGVVVADGTIRIIAEIGRIKLDSFRVRGYCFRIVFLFERFVTLGFVLFGC